MSEKPFQGENQGGIATSSLSEGVKTDLMSVSGKVRQAAGVVLAAIMAAGCGNGDVNAETGKTELITPSAQAKPQSQIRYVSVVLDGKEKPDCKHYLVGAAYPKDLRIVVSDIGDAKNYSSVDTKAMTSDISNVYSQLPSPTKQGVNLKMYEKESCKTDTADCAKEVPFRDPGQLKPGEEGITGSNEIFCR
jgi:hypothetical protein